MATLREIKRRITSIKSTEKITRAMKMVAAVKFRKAQDAVVAARPYSVKIEEILRSLVPSMEGIDNDLLTERETNRVCLIVTAADRGLCGSFNTNLMKTGQNLIHTQLEDFNSQSNLSIITIGKKSYDFFYKRDFDIFAKYTGVFDALKFSTAEEIVADIISGYREKKFDKVMAVYTEFKSVVNQKIVTTQILPIKLNEEKPAEKQEDKNTDKKSKNLTANYIFEPSGIDIVKYLLPKYLNTKVWQIILESNASEQASRMTAMETATKNAQDLISSLQLNYNRARQAAITKEILEVVGGAEALREAS